jgi:regulator of cell morphogenesis and NO signaling
MNLLNEKTLAQIVTAHPEAAGVFEKYNLDFCCKGKQLLSTACLNDEQKFKSVEKELEALLAPEKENIDVLPDDLSLSKLIDLIISRHHQYVSSISPLLFAHTQKVAEKHGERHPELLEIANLTAEICEDMSQHMAKEEGILFPGIKSLEESVFKDDTFKLRKPNMLQDPIRVMEHEHDRAGEILASIRKLTNNYTPPQDACTTYKLSFNELQEFENDLHKHVHLENNILFPKTLALINVVMGNNQSNIA